MKRLMEKQAIKKIIIILVIVLSFNFVAPTYSQADFGGVLMGPIIDFIAGVGDAVTSAFQFFMYDGNITAGNVAEGAAKGFLTIINPFDSFLLERKSDDFESKLQEYGMDAEGETADIEVDTEQFDQGWFSFLWEKDYGVPIIKYTPEKIFANKVPALDVNFIDPIDWTDIRDSNGQPVFQNAEAMNERSITIALHETIASWYVALRNLAIVALLSVLLYVAIRMVMSSIAAEKSKYKQMLIDWAVALCIVFFLHYLMSFVLNVTSMITEGVDSGTEIVVKAIDNSEGDFQFKTDLTGLCRFQIQYKDLGARFIYLVMYIALVVYTVMFTFMYVKRAITMALLTLMAPLVSITYPIDKIGDGKAQAFGIWLKEFIFNALLQPFHLIIYTIFLGASSEIAVQNPIYAILFLGFIIPSEKLLRKMFGFENSSTAGAFGAAAGAFGGAAAFKMLSNTISKARGKGGAPSGGGKDTIRTQKTIEDKNAPEGYSAFANAPTSSASRRITSGNAQNGTSQSASATSTSAVRTNGQTYNLEGAEDWSGGGAYTIGGSSPDSNLNSPDFNQAGIGYGGIRMASEGAGGATSVGTPPDQGGIPSSPNIPSRAATSEELSRRQRVINGFKSVGRGTFNKPNLQRLAKAAGRGAIRTATGATGLALGLGMGAATGDLDDVLKYGAAGATLGATALGDATLGGISKARKLGGNRVNAFQEGYYGVNRAAMRRQAREFQSNEENVDYFATEFADKKGQKLTGKALDNVMEQAAEYNNLGVTDNSSIKKSIKLEKTIMKQYENNTELSDEEKTNMARGQAATIAKIAAQVDDQKLMTDEKYVQGLQQNFKRGLLQENPAYENDQAALDAQAKNMMKLLKKYKKTY